METIKQLCYGWIEEDEAISAMNILLDEVEKTFKEKGLLSDTIQQIFNDFRK